MATKYQKQWKIPSESSPGKFYKVSLTMEGQHICHCWPFLRSRQECNHIVLAKSGAYEGEVPVSEVDKGDTLLQQFAERGYRYLTWFPMPIKRWDQDMLNHIKHGVGYEDVKTFNVDGRKFIVVKEKPEIYQLEIDNFTNEIKGCDFRKVKYRNIMKEKLKDKYFKLTQHILFNNSGIVNPNLPEGSVYNKGIYGVQLHKLLMRYKWLR